MTDGSKEPPPGPTYRRGDDNIFYSIVPGVTTRTKKKIMDSRLGQSHRGDERRLSIPSREASSGIRGTLTGLKKKAIGYDGGGGGRGSEINVHAIIYVCEEHVHEQSGFVPPEVKTKGSRSQE